MNPLPEWLLKHFPQLRGQALGSLGSAQKAGDPWMQDYIQGLLTQRPDASSTPAPAAGPSVGFQPSTGPRAAEEKTTPLGIATDLLPLIGQAKGAWRAGEDLAEGHPLAAAVGFGLSTVDGKAIKTALREAKVINSAADLRKLKRFAMFTSENPGGTTMDAERNAERLAMLKSDLAARGYGHQPVTGKYRDPRSGEMLDGEHSIVVPNLGEREAKYLGARYGQNGVITQRGYHDLVDGTFAPLQKIRATGKADEFSSIFPSGKATTLDFDWGNKQTSGVQALPVPKNAQPEATRVIDEIRAGQGALQPPLPRVKAIDKDKARMMANTYAGLPTNDPNAKGAYDALNKEIEQQHKAITDAGYKIEYTNENPYNSSKELFDDLRTNRRMKVFATPENDFHPYMTPEQNNKLRAVHDFIAHAGGGNQFGPVGEENAYRIHASTVSPEAQRALATETRGQNSWVNFGPNENKPVSERPFAQQKAALWPEEMLGDYGDMQAPSAPEAPAVHTRPRWQPTSGVFDRSPEGGVPSGQYREPAPLPFTPETGARSGVNDIADLVRNDPRVENRIRADVDRGINQGGESWFGTLPLRRAVEESGGPLSFDDFINATSAGSVRNSTHSELPVGSIMLYALRNNVSYDDARKAFKQTFPKLGKAPMMSTHENLFDRAQRLGYMAPASQKSGALKVSNYAHDKLMKASGVALDTHEMRAMSQALGLPEELVNTSVSDHNAPSYMAATEPYHRVAKDLGLHPDQVQASRWIGGGLLTGLQSQPQGDFVQTVEDALRYTARIRGLSESPTDLRKLFAEIAQGRTFFAPYAKKGGHSF